jgi:hypothetical protein
MEDIYVQSMRGLDWRCKENIDETWNKSICLV